MKKILLLSLAFVLMINFVGAQKLKLGIKAGVNGNKITGDFANIQDAKVDLGTGYLVGAFLRIYPKDKFFLQPEINYSVKKTSVEDAASATSNLTTNDIKMQNIEVPLMLGYKLFDLKLIAINALAGPVASFNTGSSQTLADINKLDFKSTSFSWQAGASVDVLSFVFDVRYEWGITDITKNNGSNRNNQYVITVGYKF